MINFSQVEKVAEFLATPAGKALFREIQAQEKVLDLPTDMASAFALKAVFSSVLGHTNIPQDNWSDLALYFEWRKIARTVNAEKISGYLMTCLSYVDFIADEVEEMELGSVAEMEIAPVEFFDKVTAEADRYIDLNAPYRELEVDAVELVKYATLRAMGVNAINELDEWGTRGEYTLEELLADIADQVAEPDESPELIYSVDIMAFYDAHTSDCDYHLDQDVKDTNSTISGMVSDMVNMELATSYGGLMYGLSEFIRDEIEEKFNDA